MCVIEEKKSANGADVHFGMITICPSTGDVVWDDFEGSRILGGMNRPTQPKLTYPSRYPNANRA